MRLEGKAAKSFSRRAGLLGGGIILVVLAALAGRSALQIDSPVIAKVLQPENREMVQQGAQLYQQFCAACHGAGLEGQPDWKTRLPNGRLPAPPHDQSGHTWHHKDELLFRITKFGTKVIAGPDYETDMRGFGSEMTDREIIAVLSYIKSTWPEIIRKRHDDLNRSK